ncbi:MAG: flagellar hook-basal body complex protein FliE [Spirochaetaceae bacterium]|jgi:flagellar hook-basal body complex protein FliE|nr:flagellar hook-basal body complex protein FliE [Spirochaetaceae bacterium]
MTIYRPELVQGDTVSLRITHPKHMVPKNGPYSIGGDAFSAGRGGVVSELGGKIGAESALRSGSFEDVMLRALDTVSGEKQFADALIQQAVIDPESVDTHDITIAQAKANMSLNITRTILNRIVQGWRDIINTR